eukprot:SAG22_NODE_9_length_35992_cov_37.278104_7_plen_88_part_00
MRALAARARASAQHPNSYNMTYIASISALTSLNYLFLDHNQITDIAPLSALTSLRTLYLNGNLRPRRFSDSDETVVLLKSRGCNVYV